VFLDGPTLTIKVDPERGEALRDAHPGVVTVAPYLSRRHWVQVHTADGFDPDEALDLLARSHALVVAGLPKGERPAVLDIPAAPRPEV
jgi:predicted DNA-binding protein (MmcQ/YjbR family)